MRLDVIVRTFLRVQQVGDQLRRPVVPLPRLSLRKVAYVQVPIGQQVMRSRVVVANDARWNCPEVKPIGGRLYQLKPGVAELFPIEIFVLYELLVGCGNLHA